MAREPKVVQIPEEFFEGLDSEDIGDMWRGIKRWRIAKKATRLEAALVWLEAQGSWIRHTQHHWSYWLDDSFLDFWPSTGKWRYKNRTHHGTLDNLIHFIAKRNK